MYCIQEADKPNLFNIIKLKQDKIILPITGEKTLTERKARKLAQKTKTILDTTVSKKIVVSKKIKKQNEYMKLLKENNLEIVNGKWLFELLSCDILEYILKKRKMKKKETSITILVNDLSENMIKIIKKIAKEYKVVNIVSKYMSKFKKLEEQILKEDGIMITVGNNKKKSLSKSEVILNVDFSAKALSEYNIYEKAIIVNVRNNATVSKKGFNGVVINDYNIAFKNFDDYDYDKSTKYRACEIYEAQIHKKQPYCEVMKKIRTDQVKIVAVGDGTFWQ